MQSFFSFSQIFQDKNVIEAGRVVRPLARTPDLGLSIYVFQLILIYLIYFSLKFIGLREQANAPVNSSDPYTIGVNSLKFLGACDRAHSKFCPAR
jgi:hypothetical protein